MPGHHGFLTSNFTAQIYLLNVDIPRWHLIFKSRKTYIYSYVACNYLMRVYLYDCKILVSITPFIEGLTQDTGMEWLSKQNNLVGDNRYSRHNQEVVGNLRPQTIAHPLV
jgi:hypothetical protein